MPQVFDDELGLKRTKLNLFDQGKSILILLIFINLVCLVRVWFILILFIVIKICFVLSKQQLTTYLYKVDTSTFMDHKEEFLGTSIML